MFGIEKVGSTFSYLYHSVYDAVAQCRSRSKKSTEQELIKNALHTPQEATQANEQEIEASAPLLQEEEKPYAPYGTKDELTLVKTQELQALFHGGSLRIEGKLLSKESLEMIAKLDVSILELRGCALDKTADFAILGYAKNLQTLVVTDDIFTDDNIGTLTLFKKLEHLHIARSEHLTEETLEHIDRFAKGLKLLTLREMTLTHAICVGIAKLPSLTTLTLSYCTGITPEVLAPLSASRSLQALTATKCATIDDKTAAVISTIKSVQRLEIIDASITTEGVKKLVSLPLFHLSVSECEKINDVAIRTLSAIKTLQDLRADYTQVTENAFSVPFPALEALSLNRCTVTSKIFPALKKSAPQLVSLSLVGTGLRDNKVDSIALSQMKLQHVDFSHTDVSPVTLNALNESIVKLRADECPKIFDTPLNSKKFKNLKLLSLLGANNDLERRYESKIELEGTVVEDARIEVSQ